MASKIIATIIVSALIVAAAILGSAWVTAFYNPMSQCVRGITSTPDSQRQYRPFISPETYCAHLLGGGKL